MPTSISGKNPITHTDLNGLNFVKIEEGLVTHVYKDQAGKPTIGVGHLLTGIERARGDIIIGGVHVDFTNGLTQSQCIGLLSQDITNAERAINNLVKVPLSQNQYDALASFTFNCGINALQTSNLLVQLNLGKYDAVPHELAKWTHSGGEVCPDLVKRRQHEAKLWNTPDTPT